MKYDLANLARRSRNPRRNAITIRPIVPPATFATDLYSSSYLAIIGVWSGAVSRILASYERSLSEITSDAPDDMTAIIGLAEAEAAAVIITVQARLRRWAERIERWQRQKWQANVLSATGVDLSTLIGPEDARLTVGAAVQRNVALVRSVSDQARGRISDAVFRGFQRRASAADVSKDIREAVAMGRRRAKNIASDQLVKIAANFNEERRRDAGIDCFEWIHSGKVHPREDHRARNGNLYSESAGRVGSEYEGKRIRKVPEDMPGQLPYCGCTTRAVLILD